MAAPSYPFVPYHPTTYAAEETLRRAQEYYAFMDDRRTVRDFSDAPVTREVIEQLILTASTAPSGAHKQPWTFCAVSDPVLKRQIREAAEKEERDSYSGRMSPEWLEDLAPLGTDWQKPFLETAPWLLIVFKKAYDVKADGTKRNNYYVSESVGIASGFLISAIHHAGLVTLTHTPSPMNFLSKLLNRPANERPFLLLPVGYPAAEVQVPDLQRKPLEEVAVWY
ncbi:nitroreductase family protein [Pontibacter akesuensis]|uniref:Nitroreductase n=1 Tax=Pontibacter akesuensis TaxID=388950 RepID=A0A1I7FNL1_9BACT|nr:nitroreductase family protein [Pontibacter akesuensis]GHA61289.1 oxidoreductase [Pontibacter akesuensis]SFU37797.1 Nitroreductase [Pontibacter akesuensis]